MLNLVKEEIRFDQHTRPALQPVDMTCLGHSRMTRSYRALRQLRTAWHAVLGPGGLGKSGQMAADAGDGLVRKLDGSGLECRVPALGIAAIVVAEQQVNLLPGKLSQGGDDLGAEARVLVAAPQFNPGRHVRQHAIPIRNAAVSLRNV